MNRLTNRLVAASAGLAASGLILTGCGAGQISQTADQESAVNGATGNAGDMALRNVHIQAVQTGDSLKPGQTVELVFVAANTSPDTNDKLVSVSSDVGSVALTGATAIPANSSLVVGTPDGQPEATALGNAAPTKAQVTLSKPISNGLTYDFTFSFDKSGQATIRVPISAGSAERQDGDPVGGHH